MEGFSAKLNDLPDEILLLIFKKLDNIEVLYSFIGVNKRFNKLVHDSIFTNHLTITRYSSNGSFDRLDNQILARFCSQILPSIHHKIKWLDIESSFMEDVLLCTSYPNLCGLDLHNIEKDIALRIFTELHVKLENFTDCLYLLDGRFDSLQKLSVNIYNILSSQIIIDNKKQLPNLKLFSLYSERDTDMYNELIVPLLHRMINLEELDLHLVVYCEKRFIDGYDLKYNIINNLLRLNKFIFNIRSRLSINDQVYLSSNEDCQLSFNGFKNNKIISCIDYFPDRKQGQCHIYSYPYQAKYYEYITNNFPDGLFKYVREVSLYDERPFEHEFFVKIAKSFPFMEQLTVYNDKPQKNKFDEQSKDDNRHLSVIQYPYLSVVDLFHAHDDYAEQFLLDIKTCLTTKLNLQVYFSTLDRVTNNFTRDTTRINCAKLLDVQLPRNISISKQLKDYFPDTKIYSLNL
ncbi:unnamed protein product [Rotaria sp. Silwood1]|nr:unnamed protein product [Rotaria sp. Silwood1]CAF1161904.1 unnamed protein product [Rotaria sp. Silwood1]CAF1166377.1 unnamed protein product [Rotaria sp. Silwood1]